MGTYLLVMGMCDLVIMVLAFILFKSTKYEKNPPKSYTPEMPKTPGDDTALQIIQTISLKDNIIEFKELGENKLTIDKNHVRKVKIGYILFNYNKFSELSNENDSSDNTDKYIEMSQTEEFDEIPPLDGAYNIYGIILKFEMIDGEEISYKLDEDYYYFRIYEYLKGLCIESVKYLSDDDINLSLVNIYYNSKYEEFYVTPYYFLKKPESGEQYKELYNELYKEQLEKVNATNKIDEGICKLEELTKDAIKKINEEYYNLMFKDDVSNMITPNDLGINLIVQSICFDDNYIKFKFQEANNCLKLNLIDDTNYIPKDNQYIFEVIYDFNFLVS